MSDCFIAGYNSAIMNIPWERIRRLWVQGGLTVLDQGVYSGTSFVITIMMARWLDVEQFGSFAVGFSILTFFLQIHTSMLLDPMAVLGPSSYYDVLKNYLFMQIRLHFYFVVPVGLGLVVVVLFLMQSDHANNLNRTLAVLGLCLSLLLLPWLIRRIFYVLATPGFALLGSLLYALSAGCGILYAKKNGILNAQTGIVLLAGSGLVSSLILIGFLLRLPNHDGSLSLRDVLMQNWQFGKWLVLSGFLIALSGQAPVFLAGVLLGLPEAGAIRAIIMLIQPMILATTAITAFVTPRLAHEYSNGTLESFNHKAQLTSFVMVGFALLFELGLLLFWYPIEAIVYNGKFVEYGSMLPYWGLVALILAGTSGMQASFQASKRPQGLLIGAVLWTPVCFGFGLWFTKQWGLWGLTASTIVGYLVLALTFGYLYWRWFYTARSKP